MEVDKFERPGKGIVGKSSKITRCLRIFTFYSLDWYNLVLSIMLYQFLVNIPNIILPSRLNQSKISIGFFNMYKQNFSESFRVYPEGRNHFSFLAHSRTTITTFRTQTGTTHVTLSRNHNNSSRHVLFTFYIFSHETTHLRILIGH